MPSSTTSAFRRPLILAATAAVVALVALVVWFLLRDAPAAVDIDEAVGAVAPSPSSTGAASSAPVDPQGTWAVDSESQPYSFDESTGTFVGFRIDEQLSTVGAATAVGRTPVVRGELTLDGTVLSAATFTADLSQVKTDDSRRDRRALAAMGVATNPEATFLLTEPLDLGSAPVPGQTIAATATGELTINGVTDTVMLPLEAALSTSGVLVVTGSVDVELATYDIEKPTAPIVVSVADVATIEVQLYLTKA